MPEKAPEPYAVDEHQRQSRIAYCTMHGQKTTTRAYDHAGGSYDVEYDAQRYKNQYFLGYSPLTLFKDYPNRIKQ